MERKLPMEPDALAESHRKKLASASGSSDIFSLRINFSLAYLDLNLVKSTVCKLIQAVCRRVGSRFLN